MKKHLLLLLFFIPYLNGMQENEDEKLPFFEFEDSKFQDIESQQNICSICQEELIGDIRTLPCSHQFHTLCIGKWEHRFDKEFHCPNCRQFTQRIFLTHIASSPALQPRVEAHPAQVDHQEDAYDGRLGCAPWWKNLKKTFENTKNSLWVTPETRGESLHEKCCTYGCYNCGAKTGSYMWNYGGALTCSSCHTLWLSDYGICFPKCCCCQRSHFWSEEHDECTGGDGCGTCDKSSRICWRFLPSLPISMAILLCILSPS